MRGARHALHIVEANADGCTAGRRAGAGHGLDSGRDIPDGIRGSLPGGAARPSRLRGRLLDGPLPGHQRALPPLRGGDRLRHVRREAAERRGLSGRASPHALRGLARLREAARARRPAIVVLVDVHARRRLAAPDGAEEHDRRPEAASGGPRHLRRCGGLRALGGQGAAQRGGVGARGPGRPRRRRVRVGRRARAARPDDGQHVAGRVPVGEPARRQVRGHLSRRRVSPQRAMACTT